jgi:hypothetical protein
MSNGIFDKTLFNSYFLLIIQSLKNMNLLHMLLFKQLLHMLLFGIIYKSFINVLVNNPLSLIALF